MLLSIIILLLLWEKEGKDETTGTRLVYLPSYREMLSGLEESFRSLGDGGRKMMFEVSMDLTLVL